MSSSEILAVPFPHPGHLFPFTELCNKLALKNFKITILYPSSSPTPSSSLHPLIQIQRFPIAYTPRFDPQILESSLSRHVDAYINGDDRSVVLAVVDEMLPWLVDSLAGRRIPTVGFFTSSAASCALDHAIGDMPRGEAVAVNGIPDMGVTSSIPRPGAPKWRPGPPVRKLAAMDAAVALMFNTCSDLEGPFLDYLAKEAKKPVWAVGPLLRSEPEPVENQKEVIGWLDSKPRGSVVYVSFGSLVTPVDAELAELVAGLADSGRPFVWVAKSDQAADRVGPNRLVVEGWAPQLAILSHPSTGGYVCHCGWNSVLEALQYGVPMLTWPIHGDQYMNAKLVTEFLKVGLSVKEAEGVEVKRGDVTTGIERLMSDEDIKKHVESVKSIFTSGFPESSSKALEQLEDLVREK